MKEKISLFCDINEKAVIEMRDADTLYQVPISLQEQHLDQLTCDHLGLDCGEADMEEWNKLVDKVRNLSGKVDIGLVGKYVELPDAYLSAVESLKHAGFVYDTDIEVHWINSEELDKETIQAELSHVDGIIVPGGFGNRGIDGKIEAIQYARENNIPFMGIGLGMQLSIVEFARNVLGLKNAHSTEINPETSHPIIDLLPEQKEISTLGGTLRLGSFPCHLKDGTKTKEAYDHANVVEERHRNRYEFNNVYRGQMEEEGFVFSGTSPDGQLVEIIELQDHPWFVATQFHPEFKSRPTKPHALFQGFIGATVS